MITKSYTIEITEGTAKLTTSMSEVNEGNVKSADVANSIKGVELAKPYSDGTEILLDSTKESTFNSWMREGGLMDFGDYINPNCIKI